MTEGRPTREKERASLGKTRHREKAPTHHAGGPAGARGASEKPVPVPAQTERGGDGDATAVGGDADAPLGGGQRMEPKPAREGTAVLPDRPRVRPQSESLTADG